MGALLGSMVAGRWETGLLCLVAAVLVAAASGASWPSRRWLWTGLVSIALGLLLNIYLTPGVRLAGWPTLLGRAATREGLALGILLDLRLLGAAAALQGLRAVWPGERAADAMLAAFRPLGRVGVPVRSMRMMVGLAVRFAPLLEREGRRIAAVQELRAGRPPRGVRERLERKRAAAVPTLVAALERADRVALALESRHYGLRSESSGDPVPVPWPAAVMAALMFGTALAWRGG